jgi:hypothetical protein
MELRRQRQAHACGPAPRRRREELPASTLYGSSSSIAENSLRAEDELGSATLPLREQRRLSGGSDQIRHKEQLALSWFALPSSRRRRRQRAPRH